MIFQNKTLILSAVLAFFVCSSKNIIIYNEEILVALSFLFFVLFSFHAFQDSLKETFESRRMLILQELEQMLLFKETACKNLQQRYTQSLHLGKTLQSLKKTALQELEQAQAQRIQAFEASIQKKCVQKLQLILQVEKQFQHKIHQTIQENFTQSVLQYFQKHQTTLIPQLFDQACQQLKK